MISEHKRIWNQLPHPLPGCCTLLQQVLSLKDHQVEFQEWHVSAAHIVRCNMTQSCDARCCEA